MGLFDDEDGGFDRVVETTEFARVDQLAGHLLIVFPIGYIPHSQTKFTVPGKKSDVIVSDIVDLDDVDETGNPGKLYRSVWFRGAQLIMSLRPRIGSKVLGRIGRGVARNGMNAPWVISDMASDPELVERAKQWGRIHSDFVTTPFQQPEPRDPIGFPPGSTVEPPRFPVQQPGQQQPFYNASHSTTYPGQQPGYPQPSPGYASQLGPVQQQGYDQQMPQSTYPQGQPAAPPPPAPVASPTQEELDMLAAMRARRAQQQSGQPLDPPF